MIGEPPGRLIAAQGELDLGQEAERDDAPRAAAIERENALRARAGEAPGEGGLVGWIFDVARPVLGGTAGSLTPCRGDGQVAVTGGAGARLHRAQCPAGRSL